jgi:hypothetical protein
MRLRVALLVAVLLAGPAEALDPLAPPQSRGVLLGPLPEPGGCGVELRVFYSLRLGPVAFCRRHLRYRPGTLECYQFSELVCPGLDAVDGPVGSRRAIDAEVFPCPVGPAPPVCRTLDLGQSRDGHGRCRAPRGAMTAPRACN